MDFTEVNFELTEGQTRRNDEQTFRELFEFICHSVNTPVLEDENFMQMNQSFDLRNNYD